MWGAGDTSAAALDLPALPLTLLRFPSLLAVTELSCDPLNFSAKPCAMILGRFRCGCKACRGSMLAASFCVMHNGSGHMVALICVNHAGLWQLGCKGPEVTFVLLVAWLLGLP